MGAPAAAAADVGVDACPADVALGAVAPVVGWVVPELDLLLDEQAATPIATARIPTPYRAFLLILTFVQPSPVNGQLVERSRLTGSPLGRLDGLTAYSTLSSVHSQT
jgi:hypothetical protein